jgi:alpha-galactosidase
MNSATTLMMTSHNTKGRCLTTCGTNPELCHHIDDVTKHERPLLNNPNASGMSNSYARTFADQAWSWGPEIVHTWYTGDDMHNDWGSTVTNVLHNYRGAEFFQKPGAWNFAGDLWCGTTEQPGNKSMSLIEEQSTYALFTIMAAPLMLGCDIRELSNATLTYLSNTELLAVNQDAWGVQGSLVGMGDGSQVFAKPLSDGSFAFALWNLRTERATVSVTWGSLAPQYFEAMSVRDLWGRRDLGIHEGGYSTAVAGHGVAIVKATPHR